MMNILLNIIVVALSAMALSGCLISERPLFPSGKFGAQKSIKSGWYFKYGIKRTSKYDIEDYRAIYLKQIGNRYEYYSNNGSDPSLVFQLFGTGLAGSPLIAQAKVEDFWMYTRVDLLDNSKNFVQLDTQCNGLGGTMDPVAFLEFQKNGMKVDKLFCTFNDVSLLASAALKETNWSNTNYYIYRRIEDKDLVDLRQLSDGPITLDHCSNGYSIASFDKGLGEKTEPNGSRRHVISASKNHLLAIEATDKNFRNWAYILLRTNSGLQSYCKPERTIKILKIFPNKNSYPISDTDGKVKENCSNTPNEACGTLGQLIESVGGEILMQGVDVVNLPKGNQAYGSTLTVMGKRGYGTFTVLMTDNDGATRVLTMP